MNTLGLYFDLILNNFCIYLFFNSYGKRKRWPRKNQQPWNFVTRKV